MSSMASRIRFLWATIVVGAGALLTAPEALAAYVLESPDPAVASPSAVPPSGPPGHGRPLLLRAPDRVGRSRRPLARPRRGDRDTPAPHGLTGTSARAVAILTRGRPWTRRRRPPPGPPRSNG
jgi:hypothetical protein